MKNISKEIDLLEQCFINNYDKKVQKVDTEKLNIHY